MDEQTSVLRKNGTENFVAILDFFNKAVKYSLNLQHYKQLGRLKKFFNTEEKEPIPEYQLDMWPGYTCQVKGLTDGFFLNVDTTTKFI